VSPRESNQQNTMDRIDAALSRRVVAWVDYVIDHASTVTPLILVLTLALLGYAIQYLRINSDNVRLIAEDLPARINHEEFARLFPNLENALFIVIDAETAELARESADELIDRIRSQPDIFSDVYMPGSGTFFEENGLLYQSPDQLDDFADQMAQVQPIIAALEVDPSIANMASLVAQGLDAAQNDGVGGDNWPALLERFGDATIAAYAEFPIAISWEELLVQGSAVEAATRRVIVTHPILDFDNVFSARHPMTFIRNASEELGLGPERGIKVRITGNPALNYEELFGIAIEVGLGGIACFFVVAVILYFALRSVPLVIACVVALLCGLIWTAAFAALAIGHLNLVSMAFAVLFIGLGVDFGIHLCMHYGDLVRRGCDNEQALRGSARGVGSSLLICSVTTAIGFFVFIPTQYLGIAELGLIAGVGMFTIFFHTMTLIPGLLCSWVRVRPESIANREFRFRTTWWQTFERHPRAIVACALLLALASLATMPRLRFDPNVINMRNPSTESVQAFNDLLSAAGTSSPWFINSVAPNLDAARERAERFAELDAVSQTIHLGNFIPDEQEEKLEILADIAFMLETPGAGGTKRDPLPVEEQIDSLRDLHEFLAATPDPNSPLNSSVQLLKDRLDVFLAKVENDANPEEALASLESILLTNLPEQIKRMRRALETDGIEMDDLPKSLVDRMLTEDGRARIQVYPSETMQDVASFTRFVQGVVAVDPKAAGVAVNLVQFGEAIRDSFKQALISAIVVIWLLLWILWRRPAPVFLATAPLILSSLLTCAVMAIFDMPFQFANVIVIPLLLGIGVDSGIHLVHRSEHLEGESESLMGSTTARAVFYSALTTTISFGTLAFSGHRGLASLGILLSIGMLLSVLSNLIFLPALIQLRSARSAGSASAGS
jgi:hopanoid biosynthesis associated RND transporter like protein HpnN